MKKLNEKEDIKTTKADKCWALVTRAVKTI